ncbi:MAG: DUF885 domain-containing protein [Gemmatimonadota bacterium]|nr:DUF885 domain-containing protein [Gemmatimonadota bacterium]
MSTRRRLLLGLTFVPVLAGSAAAQNVSLTAGGGAVAAAALAGCETDLRMLNQISGWQVRWPGALRAQPVGTPGERAVAIERWRRAPGLLDQDVERLRRGIAEDRTAPKAVVRRVLDQVDGLLDALPDRPGAGDRETGAALLSPAARADDPAFRERWIQLVSEDLAPAIGRYRDFMAGTYLPAAREEPGLASVPEGARCYREAVESWTTLRLSGKEIERRGRAYLAELTGEMIALTGARTPADLPAILDGLREGGFEDGFDSRDDVTEHAREAIERARSALPGWFAVPGEIPIEVVAIEPSLEGSFPAGFYRRPSGSGPAAYVVNPSRPAERRLMAEVIAFHEAVPGHHTSFAVPLAHGNEPMGSFNSGYVEGWAIYAERLAEEMGLYSTPLDRLGLVAKHFWAASRLVVEPGLHLHGWSRERAIEHLLDHSTLSREEAALEVDRYLAIPGQSLAYVLGFLEIRDIRRDAEAALGDRFDVRVFHDVVLRDGIRPLADVRRDVEAWVEAHAGG